MTTVEGFEGSLVEIFQEENPMVIKDDIDVTEVPDGLAAELRGMKKGWHAALEQLKTQLHV